MADQRFTFPPEANAALARGDVVLAVKLVREATGLGLKDAHDAVRAHATGMPASSAHDAGSAGGFVFPEAATAALARGDFISAIAKLREANPWLDLKSAKEAVENLRRDAGAQARAPRRGVLPAQPRVPTVVYGDSGRNGWLLLVIAAVAAAFAWWWMGG